MFWAVFFGDKLGFRFIRLYYTLGGIFAAIGAWMRLSSAEDGMDKMFLFFALSIASDCTIFLLYKLFRIKYLRNLNSQKSQNRL